MAKYQPVEWETAKPAREANVSSDVAVPLLQAAITGGLLAIPATLLAKALVPDADGLKLYAILASGFMCIAWMVLLGEHRKLLWLIEGVTGHDLDGDKSVGQPQERVIIVNGGRMAQEAKRAAESQEGTSWQAGLVRFVMGLEQYGTSQREWVERQKMDLETYKEYRDTLIRMGVADWKSKDKNGNPHEKQGWALSVPAAWILERLDVK